MRPKPGRGDCWGYTLGMLPTLLDIAAAYFIAKRLRHWKNWLAVSLLAGATIALGAMLAFGSGLTPKQAGALLLYHAAVCALSSWGFQGFARRRGH